MTTLQRPTRPRTAHRLSPHRPPAQPAARPGPRTLLEQLIRQRESTQEEIRTEFEVLARKMGEKDATMSVRHLQRLASGERPGQRPSPGTRRVMRQLFGHSMEELLGPPRPADAPAAAPTAVRSRPPVPSENSEPVSEPSVWSSLVILVGRVCRVW